MSHIPWITPFLTALVNLTGGGGSWATLQRIGGATVRERIAQPTGKRDLFHYLVRIAAGVFLPFLMLMHHFRFTVERRRARRRQTSIGSRRERWDPFDHRRIRHSCYSSQPRILLPPSVPRVHGEVTKRDRVRVSRQYGPASGFWQTSRDAFLKRLHVRALLLCPMTELIGSHAAMSRCVCIHRFCRGCKGRYRVTR